MTRSLRRALALLGAGALVLQMMSSPALASSSFDLTNGVLTITGSSSNDIIDVTCSGGTVHTDVDSLISCAGNIKHIVIDGLGGNDQLQVDGATPGAFPNLIDTKLVGGPGNDDLTSGPLTNTLLGGAGNDIFRPGGGADTDKGGKGYDTFYTSNGADQTISDTHYSGTGAASLSSIESAHLLSGATDDTLDGTGWTQGALFMGGGAGNDTLLGGSSWDNLNGGDGSDVLMGNGGNDTLQPDAGTTPQDDQVFGGPGRDALDGSQYGTGTITDTQTTFEGTDQISSIEQVNAGIHFSFAGPASIDSSAFSGNTSITGTSQADTFVGGSGNDIYYPGAGNDSIHGGGGRDGVSVNLAGAGSVNISDSSATSTSAGTDSLTSIERAWVYGDSTTQSFGSSAFSGTAYIQGGGGDDLVNGNGAGTTFVENNLDSPVTVTDGAITSPTLTAGLANVGNVQVSLGSSGGGTIDASAFSGKTLLSGGNGNDTLVGSPQADRIMGWGGNDSMRGLGGNDILWGATGKDKLNGGAGTDRCDATAQDKVISCEKKAPPLPT